jgi:nucleoside-diphosphate-sugar epimerase
MNAFVTGATGFVGRHLVRTLLKQKNQVTALVRTQKQARLLKNQGAKTIVSDLTNPRLDQKLLPHLKKADVVFHLAAILAEWGPSQKDYQQVNVQATQKLLKVSWQAGIKHFILVSTAHVLGNPPPKTPASEKSPPQPASAYSRSKLEAEKLCQVYFNRGLPVTILRPSFIYGPGDQQGAISRFCQQIKKGQIIIVGQGKNRFQPIFVKDLVSGLLKAAQKPGQGETYLLAGSQKVSLNQLFKLIAQTLKVKPAQVIQIPHWPALPLSYPLALASHLGRQLNLPLLKNEPPLTPRKVHFITGNFTYQIKKAQKKLGWQPRYDLKKGLQETATWLKSSGV